MSNLTTSREVTSEHSANEKGCFNTSSNSTFSQHHHDYHTTNFALPSTLSRCLRPAFKSVQRGPHTPLLQRSDMLYITVRTPCHQLIPFECPFLTGAMYLGSGGSIIFRQKPLETSGGAEPWRLARLTLDIYSWSLSAERRAMVRW